jgi:hypothetical protein
MYIHAVCRSLVKIMRIVWPVGITWLIILGGGGEVYAKSTMGGRSFNLQRSQVKKLGKVGLNTGFSFFFLSLHHQNNRLENISVYLPLFNSVAKKLSLGRKYIGGAFAPPPSPTPPPPMV